MLNTAFSPWPSYTEEESLALTRVLQSNKVNYWTGTECREFEKEFAVWSGSAHAIAVMNGTVALDAALLALDIGAGDEVIVTSRTFLASASCIVTSGAIPVFADVDRDSQNLTVDTIRPLITPNTKAIICVHLAGWPCEMEPIMQLAEEHGLYVIEDCAQAHGARYQDRSVGSFGHVSAWSFCQDKIMTTGGEGGMITTNDSTLWKRMWSYKDHGKSWEAVYEREHAPGFRWIHDSFGTNWRMTELQAAIGRIQLKRMPEWQRKRMFNAQKIWDTAAKFSALRVPIIPQHIVHAAYKCYIFVNPEALVEGWDRDRLLSAINAQGVPCYTGTCSEVYLETAFDGSEWRPAQRLKAAKELGETSLMFLVHPTLQAHEIDKTCDVLTEIFSAASLYSLR